MALSLSKLGRKILRGNRISGTGIFKRVVVEMNTIAIRKHSPLPVHLSPTKNLATKAEMVPGYKIKRQVHDRVEEPRETTINNG